MKYSKAGRVNHAVKSHPARGAWIEMVMAAPSVLVAPVAPRKGGVD